MSLALDTDVLVSWAMTGAPRHSAARRLVRSEVSAGRPLAITLQVLDTALAATLEEAGVRRLATFNRRDFEVFAFRGRPRK